MQIFERWPVRFAVAGAVGLTAIAVATLRPEPVAPTPMTVAAMTFDVDVADPVSRSIAHEDAPPAPEGSDFAFTIVAGTTAYAVLPGDVDAVKHGRGKVVHDKYEQAAAVAPVEASAMPAGLRGWLGRRVADPSGCTATVTGFAAIARVSGVSADVGAPGGWTPALVWEHGAKLLAAKLDRACPGRYVSDATRPALRPAREVTDDALVARVKADLFASKLAGEVDVAWDEYDEAMNEDGPRPAWRATVPMTSHVFEHPATHERWVMIDAGYGDFVCGGVPAHIWGVYRVRGERLERVHGGTGHGDSPSELVDIDGDGTFSVITQPLFADIALHRAGRAPIVVGLPFFGCPC